MNQIGVTIEERVINAVNLSFSSGRNIGMLMERERGRANFPTLISSLLEDRRIFGGNNTSMYSPYVVENLFSNSGGYSVNLYGVRIVGAGSKPAEVTVKHQYPNIQTLIATTVQNATATEPQITEVVPSDVNIGDSFTITINGTNFTFVATAATVANVITGLVTAVNAGAQPVTASNGTTKVVLTADADDVPFTVTTSTINVATPNDNIFKLKAGYQGVEDPGTWGNDLKVRVYPVGDPQGSNDGYLLQVFYKNALAESYVAATWANLEAQVNARSEYVMMEEIDYTKSVTLGVFQGNLSGGVYNAPTENQFYPDYDDDTQEPLGMALFDGLDVQILCCPEVYNVAFAKACQEYAEAKKKFFVFNLPYLATESVAMSYYQELITGDPSFCASYLNWAEVNDGNGGRIWIPSIGYVLGSGYIKRAGLYNGAVWTPPAGIETTSRGIYRFTHNTLTDDVINRYVTNWRTNVVKQLREVGYIIWSSRTYSSNKLFESIHVRIETNWLVENLPQVNQQYIQRLFSPSLQKEMLASNTVWWKLIYERGGVESTVPFNEAVVITITVDPADRKHVSMDVAWIPPETVEHLHIRLSRNDGVLVLNA